jgi:hypothetical protein
MNDDISIDVEENEDGYQNTNLIFEKYYFIEISTHRSGSPPLLTPARPARGGGTDL